MIEVSGMTQEEFYDGHVKTQLEYLVYDVLNRVVKPYLNDSYNQIQK